MGLDNIPRPYPCVANRYAMFTADRRIDCDATRCPFMPLKHIVGILGTYCWLRGKVYNRVVHAATNGRHSLYNDLGLAELREILEAVKGWQPGEEDRREDPEVEERRRELVQYLETLIAEVERMPEEVREEFELYAWY